MIHSTSRQGRLADGVSAKNPWLYLYLLNEKTTITYESKNDRMKAAWKQKKAEWKWKQSRLPFSMLTFLTILEIVPYKLLMQMMQP